VNLTEKDVREILRLLDETEYDELKLQTDGFNITLRQSAEGSGSRVAETTSSEAEPATVSDAPPAGGAAPAPGVASDDVRDIYPPLPGTFYRAPSPGADPFVEVGAAVKDDTVVGLVETMKLMNSVMAGCRGEVIEICVDNGALIEADTVLLRIRES
jgi:acetyl-CoA carboxylase biotin carboxyl carrier protein